MLLCVDLSKNNSFFALPKKKSKIIFITLFHFISSIMSHLTPNEKHNILRLYVSSDHRYTMKSLSQQHNIKGGRKTMSRWLQQWDGSPESLERREGSGRHTILTSKEVKDTIQLPIRNKNPNSQPVHYTDLLPSVTEKTGKKISSRTLRRIGLDQSGAKQKRTNKRTAVESKHTHTITFQ